MRVRVGVVGYGTIGKRVAWAVSRQPDLELVGVAKTRPDWEALSATKKGYRLFVPKEREREFRSKGLEVSGTVEDLVASVDVVVDATPSGVGAANKLLYDKLGKRAVFQGGERADVAEVSFNALVNYEEALGKRYVRVVSCNTTGILRMIFAMSKVGEVARVRAVIVRRGADLKEVERGPIEGLVLDPPKVPSHHAVDVRTVIKNLDIVTYAVVAPTTLAHMHFATFIFRERVPRDSVAEALAATPRVLLVDGDMVRSTAELRELARDLGRPFGDIYENVVWLDSLYISGCEVSVAYAVHQEAVVVPENVDAIRAIAKVKEEKFESVRVTDEALGIKRLL